MGCCSFNSRRYDAGLDGQWTHRNGGRTMYDRTSREYFNMYTVQCGHTSIGGVMRGTHL